MAVFLLSLAGHPADGGVHRQGGRLPAAASGAGYWPLVLIGVLVSVVAAFFYLRVIVLMYMRDPPSSRARRGHGPSMPRLALAIPAA